MVTPVCECNTDELVSHFLTPIKATGNCVERFAGMICNALCTFFPQDFGCMEDTVFCGVFDGHGPYGHLVARRVRDSMPSKVLHYWQEEQAQRDDGEQNTTVETLNSQELRNPHEHGEHEHEQEGAQISGFQNHEDAVAKEDPIFGLWKESHLAAYRVMDKELRSHPGIDCFCSGTTAVTVLKQVQNTLHYIN